MTANGRTTAATVATSQPVEPTRRASIEEVEDEENVKSRSKGTLPASGRYTLMTESEYREEMIRSEREENDITKNHKKDQPQVKHRGGIDNSSECEPTSSKVKLEQLVTDEDEELVTEGDDSPRVNDQSQELFDRPIPPPETYHAYDPRLPKELNELLGTMQVTKWQALDTEKYRDPLPEEILETNHIPKPKRNPTERKRNPPPQFRLPSVDDSLASLDALRRKHDPVRRKPPDANRLKPPSKGKEKATTYTEDDIPSLTQQWCDGYQDILQGTPEELPPLREVNHEINLINPDHRYTYHLPRCPEAYREEFYSKLD